ncbi:MAG TPA: DnaB-like helicase C-terminal domain-containing protein [Gemmatimonadaceae bacterium]
MSYQLGPEFQRALLRLCLDNEAFAVLVAKHLKPSFFETPALSWIFSTVQWYLTAYTRPPTPFLVIDACRRLDPALAAQYLPTVESVCTSAVVEEKYIGDKLTEFIKRNLVVDGVEKLRLLYNQGDIDATVRFFNERAEEIQGVNIGAVDRSFFFEEIDARTLRRAREASQGHLYTFSTGVPDLDAVLNGGLSKGEMGIWVAYPKVGKSHMLQWLAYYAVRALRIPVLYVVLEGGREQAEDRFEAAFTYSTAMDLKHGNVDANRMRAIRDEYRELKDLLVIRGYTKDAAWNASVTDVYAEIVDLRQRRGFRPRLIVIDYGDLLHPREKQESEVRSQAAAFRDMKALCDRDEGYALWTASQAQRPLKGAADNPDHIVRSSQIADCYEKVRCADFIGSLNRTGEEARTEKMRIFAELYRSAPAGRLIEVRTDFAHHRAVTTTLRSTQLEESREQLEVDW